MHGLRETALADDFMAGSFAPMEKDEYFSLCRVFLQHLKPEIAVHRLAAFSSRPQELLAPAWTALKMELYQGMLEHMRRAGAYQGQHAAP